MFAFVDTSIFSKESMVDGQIRGSELLTIDYWLIQYIVRFMILGFYNCECLLFVKLSVMAGYFKLLLLVVIVIILFTEFTIYCAFLASMICLHFSVHWLIDNSWMDEVLIWNMQWILTLFFTCYLFNLMRLIRPLFNYSSTINKPNKCKSSLWIMDNSEYDVRYWVLLDY